MNYQHCILLGAGSIGRSLLKIGGIQLSAFKTLQVVDRKPLSDQFRNHYRSFEFLMGDAGDLDMLTYLSELHAGRVLFINLCSSVDSVRLRRHIAGLNAAYLDSSASILPDKAQSTYEEMMSYTHTHVESRYPQWICWGLNPGIVELVARRLMRNTEQKYRITIYEDDSLFARTQGGGLGVGWSPDELIEEVMLTPAFEVRSGTTVQRDSGGAGFKSVRWDGRVMPFRLVAHEDIWNLGLLPQVASARFLYAFHPDVMGVLNGKPEIACERLSVPGDEVPLRGTDRVIVQVLSDKGEEQSLIWETDHARVWAEYGVNAVQYQVCRSIQVALELLQNTELGNMPGTYCASTIPLSGKDWEIIERAFISNGIHWRPADGLRLEVLD